MKTILIIDDEEDFHRVLKRILEPQGYKTLSSLSAEEALRMLEALTPNLAIIDWNLPGKTGLELVRMIRQMEKFKKMPIIMYTVRDTESDQIEAYSSDIQLFLTKPVESGVLIAKIKQFFP
ncbi:MAG: response regulator [Elusimicrobia bacterium]|nr:response regulator [Elusimicrobiota bacterium]